LLYNLNRNSSDSCVDCTAFSRVIYTTLDTTYRYLFADNCRALHCRAAAVNDARRVNHTPSAIVTRSLLHACVTTNFSLHTHAIYIYTHSRGTPRYFLHVTKQISHINQIQRQKYFANFKILLERR